MKKQSPLVYTALLTTLILSLYTSPAFSFNPDEYTYKNKLITVDGDDMIILRVYDDDQKIEFSAEDLNSDEGDDLKVNRDFNTQDLDNVKSAMRYIKDVFGVPTQTPVIETITNDEDNAAFASPVSGKNGLYGSRLSTWFISSDVNTQLPTGFLEIGDMGDKDGISLHPLVDRGEGAAMASVIIHEMMHGMGISTTVDNDEDTQGKITFFAPNTNSIFSGHLYDIYNHQLQPGMIFKKGPVAEPEVTSFYQYDNGSQSGAYFWGDNVEDVLTVSGETTGVALPNDELDGLKVKGIPVNGYEDTYDEESKRTIEFPELSHLELQNSMMSHQTYRNWGIFMEAELAVLQDIGFTNIDRRRFFGFSIYNDNLIYTNTAGFDSDQNWGVGLHIYGSNNTITQQADIETRGEDAYGVRIDGQKNTFIVPSNTKIYANGDDNAGILVSYGNSHNLNIRGDVEATGANGVALRFDFGGNLLGDQEEYRGSYFQIKKDDDTEQWGDISEDSVLDALNGPLANQVDISGTLIGDDAAIYIADNALVRQINILNGASVKGDFLSEWSSSINRYGEYGDDITLFKPAGEVDRTLLTFGYAADEQGQSTEYADPNFEMTYNGSIIGADGFDVQLAGGKLTYGGIAHTNILQTEENTELALDDGYISANTIAGQGTVSMAESSFIVVKGEDGQAQFNNLTIKENADAGIYTEQGLIEINTMQNAGIAEFTADNAQEGLISIETYAGTDGSQLSLNLSSSVADQLQGSTTSQTVQQGAKVLTIDNNTTSSDLNLHIVEGDVSGEIDAVIGADGNILSASEKKNSASEVLQEINNNGFQVFRAQMNDLEKRMGDLRNMPGDRGTWAKVIAGKSKYKSMHNDYKTFQFGIDQQFGDFFAGVMSSYTKGDGKLRHGSSDDKNYSFGLYGGWLGKDGQFVDLTLKRHRLKSDYKFNANSNYFKNNYKTYGTSASVEYGWRYGIKCTGYYVEPQTEFLYGYLDGKNYETNQGVSVHQSDIKSAVGRLGVAVGWISPDKKGNVYVKASVLNDWKGDSKVRMRKGNVTRRYHEDMGGTWGEFALGGTLHFNNNLSAYGEMETTTGSPVRTVYEFNAGLRFNF